MIMLGCATPDSSFLWVIVMCKCYNTNIALELIETPLTINLLT